MQSQTKAVDLFRSAVSAGAFSEAEQLLESYRREVESSWHAATSDDERFAIAMEVTDVFEWARTATLSIRAHTQRRLILLRREASYTPTTRRNELLNLEA
jgi:hypothetical protein